MNSATKDLEKDHTYILRLMDVMEKMVIRCSTDMPDFEMMVKLIQEFADKYHHAKEEDLFFPFLLKKGFSNEKGPVSVMLQDHNQGREFVKGMVAGIEKVKLEGDTAWPEVYLNMQGYIDLLRLHISKENNVLYKMADRLLSTVEQEHLLLDFKAVEKKKFGNGKIDQFIVDIEGLEVIYS